MHQVFALLCFVVVIHWLIFPYPSGLLHWHCGNLTIAPVPAKQPWWIWINTSCEFIMNDCITTTKQSTTKPCAYLLGYTVGSPFSTACSSLLSSSIQTILLINFLWIDWTYLSRINHCYQWYARDIRTNICVFSNLCNYFILFASSTYSAYMVMVFVLLGIFYISEWIFVKNFLTFFFVDSGSVVWHFRCLYMLDKLVFPITPAVREMMDNHSALLNGNRSSPY